MAQLKVGDALAMPCAVDRRSTRKWSGAAKAKVVGADLFNSAFKRNSSLVVFEHPMTVSQDIHNYYSASENICQAKSIAGVAGRKTTRAEARVVMG
jgi:hypothetical protein